MIPVILTELFNFQCTEVAYCSLECYRLAWKEYHQRECGILGFLIGTNQANQYSVAHTFHLIAKFGLKRILLGEEQESKRHLGEPYDCGNFFASDGLRTKSFMEMSDLDRTELYQALASLLSHRGSRDDEKERHFTVASIVVAYCLLYKVGSSHLGRDFSFFDNLKNNISN